MKIDVRVIAVMFVLFVAGPVQAVEKGHEQLLKEAREVTTSVSIQETKKMLDAKENVVFLDVRDMKQFVEGHISGAISVSRAINMSHRLLEYHMQKTVPDKNARIIVYCDFVTRSPLAVRALNEIGYKNATYLDDGLVAWKKAGYPVVK